MHITKNQHKKTKAMFSRLDAFCDIRSGNGWDYSGRMGRDGKAGI